MSSLNEWIYEFYSIKNDVNDLIKIYIYIYIMEQK